MTAVAPTEAIYTTRLTLHLVSEADARAIRAGQPAWSARRGYDIAQLRISAGVLLEHPATRFMFVIEHGQHDMIGFVAIDWDNKSADHAYVAFIEIAEDLWDERYGREVLDAVVTWARSRGARRLTAEIPPENARSKRLFERLGFRRPLAPAQSDTVERWEWSAMEQSAQRVRRAIALHWSSALNHEDVLSDIEPFYRPFADRRSTPGRPTTHRLLRLVEAVEADRDAVREKRATQYLPELIELRHVANTLRNWSGHAVGKKIVANLRDSHSYSHNVVVLSAHRMLHSWGNAFVELVEEDAQHATTDLRVVVGSESVGTEVKVPDELRDGRDLTPAEADRVADDALRSSKKQRQGQPSFVLVVGGFQVPERSLILVSSALERQLEKSSTRSNIAGAIALTVGRHPDDIPLTIERDTPMAGVYAQFAAQLNPALFEMGVAARNARNAKYAGPVRVLRFREPSVGLHLP
ncbi:MAG: GNAT family N-acetyltransferase [Chloroflexi bacterium]|nr:GNAT family N-acetyltransferase [Chloroflexota bacterium]